jgi:acyl-CoA synthetase (AMP-forming)/AMP-acid ligase II
MDWNLADMFEATADAVPDRTALICWEHRLTYGELEARANRVAHHLQSQGVAAGDHIGIYASNCAEWVETMLGAYKARAVPVNVNYRYVDDELRYLFDNADMVALVHQPEYAERVAAVRDDVPSLRFTLELGDDYERALAASSPERDFAPRAADDRYVLYTGGTTGMPKGVVWRHDDAFFALLGGGNFGGPPVSTPDELAKKAPDSGLFVALVCPPLMHGGGQWTTLSGLLGGAVIALLEGRFDPVRVWEIVTRDGVNTMSLIGDAMARPLADAYRASPGAYDASKLFVIGSGGAPLTPAVKHELKALLPHVLIMDSFGASETGYQGRVEVESDDAKPRFTMSAVNAVLDDDLQIVQPGSGVVGRVARRGHIPVEYYKDGAKTAETFVDVDGERWALLGDMATVEADGTITLFGRGSMCINSGGEKIFPEEVEAALKAHPDVFDALVVGLPDDRFGERVAAVVAPREGHHPTGDALAAHCRESVAGYKVPREFHFTSDSLRQPSGKPDYRHAKEVATKGR